MSDILQPAAVDVVLRAQSISKRHGSVEALHDVSIDVHRGEIVAVLGPSGCGKSTFLASLAGLVRIDAGTISLGDRTVSGDGIHVPPQSRRVGLVFQDHALFPHKTVADNVGFGLHGIGRSERNSRVREMLTLVRMEDKADRFPHELSGGESQRVALARALAPSPDVLLLDEPFASLDPTLRAEVRDEVCDLLRSVGAAAVLVSHDIDDALALGDRLAVLRAGRVVQIDTAERLHRFPVDDQVAGLFGAYNALPATVRPDGSWSTALGSVASGAVIPWATGPVVIARPGAITVLPPGSEAGVSGVVRQARFVGHALRLAVRTDDGTDVLADVSTEAAHAVGDRVQVALLATRSA